MKKIIFISAMLLASFVLQAQEYVETLHDGNNGYINNVGAGNLDFQHEGSTKMSLTDVGRLGIGTTAPAQALHVKGRARASFMGDINEYVEIYHGGSNGFINTVGDGNLDFRHGGSTKMSLTSTGRVGIGVANPAQALHVKGRTRASYAGDLNEYVEIHHGGNNGFINTAGDGNLDFRHDAIPMMAIKPSGKVVIGDNGYNDAINTPGDYKLYVEEGILTEKVKVATINSADWADYVFEEDYNLNSTEEVETFIKENKHLPNVPSAKTVSENGVDMVEMDATLLRQIEELWLHVIELKKENEVLKEKMEAYRK